MEERRVDLRIPNPERSKEGKRTTGILHRFNAADPLSVEYQELMKELFTGGFWEKSKVVAPFYANLAADIHSDRCRCKRCPYQNVRIRFRLCQQKMEQ